MRHLVMLGLVMLMVGCGDDESDASAASTDADRLFAIGKSESASPTSIEGIWETKSARVQSGLESMIRLELRADRMVAAVRCTPTSGGDATLLDKAGRAAVSSSAIDVPEELRVSKEIGESYCGVVFRAGTLPACDVRLPLAERKSCFELAKGVLTVREESTSVDYVKLAD